MVNSTCTLNLHGKSPISQYPKSPSWSTPLVSGTVGSHARRLGCPHPPRPPAKLRPAGADCHCVDLGCAARNPCAVARRHGAIQCWGCEDVQVLAGRFFLPKDVLFGFWNMNMFYFSIDWEESSQLTIFQRGRYTTNQ